ncbi:MAG: hypothetical protein ACYTBZ_03765 [Planctomycetota bacterium]
MTNSTPCDVARNRPSMNTCRWSAMSSTMESPDAVACGVSPTPSMDTAITVGSAARVEQVVFTGLVKRIIRLRYLAF